VFTKGAQILHWAKNATLAVTDQALISVSNFVLSVILARLLGANEYGAYTLAFSVFLLLANVQYALVLEPMSVLGPSLYWENRHEYLGLLIWVQIVAGITLVGVLTIVGALLAWTHFDHALVSAFKGLAVAAPCILLFWLARGACYLFLRPSRAVAGSVLYALCVASGALALCWGNWLSSSSVFLIMGAGALLAGIYVLTTLKPVLASGILCVRRVTSDHWDYGRWALATGGVQWLSSDIWYLITGAEIGLAAVGALRAILNFFLPLSHILGALRRLVQPVFAAVMSRGSSGAMLAVKQLSWAFTAVVICYCVAVAISSKALFRYLYAGQFLDYAFLVPWVCFSVLLTGAYAACGVGLRALRAPASVFVADCFGAVMVLLGLPAAKFFGLPGVVAASSLPPVVTLISTAFLFRRKVRGAVAGHGSRLPRPAAASAPDGLAG
jgi:O-antigen/teichoic acid export membrane protein